jgi:hypothetical protein
MLGRTKLATRDGGARTVAVVRSLQFTMKVFYPVPVSQLLWVDQGGDEPLK